MAMGFLRGLGLRSIAVVLLLAAAAAADEQAGGGDLATGSELLGEMQQLKAAIVSIQTLMKYADIPPESPIMSDAAKLIRRVSSLVYANDLLGESLSGEQLRTVRVEKRVLERQIQRVPRRVGGGLRAWEAAEEGEAPFGDEEAVRGLDEVERNLYMTTTTFPECRERLLEHCLSILNRQLFDLKVDCDFIIHEKRSLDQAGYNKVVIVTNLAADHVLGRLGDGIVEYPFLWDDPASAFPRRLGVDGKWECHELSPEQCCELVKRSAPNPDAQGNMLACHIFVPYGGAGHKKRDNRLFINVSQDGRVQESPYIS